jgi:hypothetical protein
MYAVGVVISSSGSDITLGRSEQPPMMQERPLNGRRQRRWVDQRLGKTLLIFDRKPDRSVLLHWQTFLPEQDVPVFHG